MPHARHLQALVSAAAAQGDAFVPRTEFDWSEGTRAAGRVLNQDAAVASQALDASQGKEESAASSVPAQVEEAASVPASTLADTAAFPVAQGQLVPDAGELVPTATTVLTVTATCADASLQREEPKDVTVLRATEVCATACPAMAPDAPASTSGLKATTRPALYPDALPGPPPVVKGVAVTTASVTHNVSTAAVATEAAAASTRHYDRLVAHPLSRKMPAGLCKVLSRAAVSFPLRVMIVDNSGSMCSGDGNRYVTLAGGEERRVRCTRWAELGADVERIATLSEAMHARTDIHLLNATAEGLSFLSIASDAWDRIPPIGAAADVSRVREMMATSPRGRTPLTGALELIISMIEPHASSLNLRGERVTIILATDGLPDNKRSFLLAIRRLHRLPVALVVRLCTDDDSVVGYWNELDGELETSLDVIDDLYSEAIEVGRVNPWLTYGAPLHYSRIFGLPGRLYDLIDETRLLPAQIKLFAEELLGATLRPEPELEPFEFVDACRRAGKKVPLVFDPRTNRTMPWLDAFRLERALVSCGTLCSQTAQCAVM